MDPFSEEPLRYNSQSFDRLLVRYRPIEEVDDVLDYLYKEKDRLMRRKYYVIGKRGMGKTTIFNYILNQTLRRQESKILPIYVNNVHIKDPADPVDPALDPDKLRLNFCLRTIEAIFETVLHTLKDRWLISEYSFFERIRAEYFEKKGKIAIDQASAEALLKEYLTKLKKDFEIFVLLYDELDKIDVYETVLVFLHDAQGLLESLSTYGCVLFFSGVPDFSQRLRSSEYKGVSGQDIWIHTWSPEDAKALIMSRLNYALYQGEFPFSDKAIEIICGKAEGRPRLIQSEARDAMVWAAFKGVRNIKEDFLDMLIWKDESVKRFIEEVPTDLRLREARDLLDRVYNPDHDDPMLFFVLTKIYAAQRIFKVPSAKLREDYGIEMDGDEFERLVSLLKDFKVVEEKYSDGRKYYVLEKRIQSLFGYVRNILDESLEYLPRMVKAESWRVQEGQLRFNLSNEAKKIFLLNPQHRYRRSEIAKEIIKNPDTRIRALSYYGVSSEKDLMARLSRGLGQVLMGLQKKGFVTAILAGRDNVYQFLESSIEIDWARGLRLDEDVMKNMHSAAAAIGRGDYSGSAPLLRLAVETSLRHLADSHNLELPSKRDEDTVSPINQKLAREAKLYGQDLETMISAFAFEINPICHGRVKLDSIERAKNFQDRARMIIQEIYRIKKETQRRGNN